MVCEPDKITVEGMCEMCTIAGEVPKLDRLMCIACELNQIAVDGQCQNCPNEGEVPNEDRISCSPCPGDFVLAVDGEVITDCK